MTSTYLCNNIFKTADQLMAGTSVLSRPAEEFENDVSKIAYKLMSE